MTDSKTLNKAIEVNKIAPKKKYQELDKVSILVSICFFLSLIENFIPKPLPFLRLGIANLPLILGLLVLNPKQYFLLGLLKILGQALISGSFLSYVFVFSIVGTIASILGMFLLYKLLYQKNLISFIGISCFGSILSCISQSLIGYYWIFGQGMKYIFPLFFIFSAITGFLLGFFCNIFSQNSLFLQNMKNPEFFENTKKISNSNKKTKSVKSIKQKKEHKTFLENLTIYKNSPINHFVAAILFISILLFTPNLLVKTSLFLLFFIFNSILIFLEKNNSKQRIKRQIFQVLITIFSITLINLFTPFGKILFQWKFITISEGAFFLGLKRSIEFEGILYISRWFFPKMTTGPKNNFCKKNGFFSLLTKGFYFFNILSKQTKKIKPKTFIKDLDFILLSCFFSK